MYNDILATGFDSENTVVSPMTWAMFIDTGWYGLRRSPHAGFQWGDAKGCEFFTKDCITNGKANFEEFCYDEFCTPRCNHSHTHIGGCGLPDLMTPFPPIYDYLRENMRYLGSADYHVDQCPHVITIDGGDCRVSELLTISNMNHGEKRCPNCRCIEGIVAPSGYIPKQYAGCFEIVCTATHIIVTIAET
jgi:hypothetical protein